MPSSPSRESRDPPSCAEWWWLDAVAIALGAFALCSLLAQTSEFIDSAGYLLSSQRGHNNETRHVGYTPLLIAWTRMLEPLGFTHLERARSFSAFGIAIGVLLAHRVAAECGFGRVRQACLASVVASAPSAIFAGTVVGPYAPFFALAMLVGWGGVLLVRDGFGVGSTSRAIGFGALCGVSAGYASTVHSTGSLLLILLGLAVWVADFARRTPHRVWPSRRAWVALLAIVSGRAAFGVLHELAHRGLGWPKGQGALEFLWVLAEHAVQKPVTLFGNLWSEWGLAYAPFCVVPLLAVFVSRLRIVAVTLSLAILGYQLVSWFLLQGGSNVGVYSLPLVLPLAWLTTRWLAPRLVLAGIAVGLAIGIALVQRHDRPERADDYVAGLRVVAEGEPVYLLGGIGTDIEVLFARLPDQPFFFLPDLVMHETPAVQAALPSLAAHLAERRAAGSRVLLTDDAWAWLQKLAEWPTANAGSAVLEFFANNYTLERVQARGFGARRLEPK